MKKVSLLDLSLDPVCTGGGFTLYLTHQGAVETSTYGGANANLLAQHFYGRLDLADSLWMAAKVRLDVIPSADKAFYDLGTFAFVALYLISAGERHLSAVSEIVFLL